MSDQAENRPREETAEDAAADQPLEESCQAEELSEMASLERQRDEFRDLLQRKQAEFENFRKRTQREKSGIRIEAQAEILAALLPTLDAAEKGLHSFPAKTDDPLLRSYRQGYELLVKELTGLLDRFGAASVAGVGHRFDPELHEAVMREETNQHRDGKILEEYRRGYTFQGRLLRAAQVKVAVAPADAEEKHDGEQINVDFKA